MSQAKVDQYKEQKAKRKEIIAKEKAQSQMRKVIAIVIAVICIGWVGYSVYGVATRPDTTGATVNLDSYNEYLNDMAEEN